MSETVLLHSLLTQSASKYPEKQVLLQAKEQVHYRELARRAARISQWLLQHDLQVGDRVAILTDQSCEYVAAYFGIVAAGGIVVGLNTQTSGHVLETILCDSECSIVLSHRKFKKYASIIVAQPSVRHFEPDMGALWGEGGDTCEKKLPLLNPEDIAQILYTSGTTGVPKGVMLSHRNLVSNTLSIVEYLRLTEKDKVMAVLPFFYSYGNSVMLTHIAVGGSLVVNQSFLYPNVILDQMREEDVTGFSGVPSSFALLLHRSAVREYTFPHLRYLTQAGAAMSPVLAQQLSQVFPDVDIFIMYGQTEASARLSYLQPERMQEKEGSIGKAIPGVTLEVCRPDGSRADVGEVGEIVASGGNIMAGYWQQPKETDKVLDRGRLWTGDLAKVDKDGFFFIQSRKSDMIKSGSHRIAPMEIENVILGLICIHEVAVVGAEDVILGEKIVAFVVLKDETECSTKKLLRHCRQNLPAFKVPHDVVFMDALPKTSTGKVKKIELKT